MHDVGSRFLALLEWYGRTCNRLITLTELIVLAVESNRTLILPTVFDGQDAASLLDLVALANFVPLVNGGDSSLSAHCKESKHQDVFLAFAVVGARREGVLRAEPERLSEPLQPPLDQNARVIVFDEFDLIMNGALVARLSEPHLDRMVITKAAAVAIEAFETLDLSDDASSKLGVLPLPWPPPAPYSNWTAGLLQDVDRRYHLALAEAVAQAKSLRCLLFTRLYLSLDWAPRPAAFAGVWRALQPAPKIRIEAASLASKLGNYLAVHLRLGDQEDRLPDFGIDFFFGAKALIHTQLALAKSHLIYLATDDREHPLSVALKEEFRTVDVLDALGVLDTSLAWRLMFDLEMCARAKRFYGSDSSTVSFVVLQWRRYRFRKASKTVAFWPTRNGL